MDDQGRGKVFSFFILFSGVNKPNGLTKSSLMNVNSVCCSSQIFHKSLDVIESLSEKSETNIRHMYR